MRMQDMLRRLFDPALAGVLAAARAQQTGGNSGAYPGESNYDTTVGPDEALVNLRIRNHRWPDCYSLETIVADIFRLEGLDDTLDASEAKAFAL